MRSIVRGAHTPIERRVPGTSEWGSGCGTTESHQRNVLLGGYRVADPSELDEGETAQANGYDVAIITPSGALYGMSIVLEPGDF